MSQSPSQPAQPDIPVTPIPYAAVERPHLDRDRRLGLIAFGTVSILIGALAGFFAGLTSFAVMMVLTHSTKTPLWPFFAAPFINAAAATLFIWTGIASIRCKRWARPVAISFGWPALIGGVMGLAGCLLLRKEVPSPPRGLNATTILAALFTFFGILIPAAFLWFYSTDAVRKTLAAYDPAPSWTQRPPLPVFAGSVNLVFGGLITLSLATFRAAPLFGQYLEGAAGAVLVVAAALVMFAAAVLFYRVRFLGWLMALAVVVCGFVSAMLTIGQLGVHEFYRHGGVGGELLDALLRSPTMTGPTPLVFVAILFTICLLYLLWVRPHFAASRREAAPAAAYPSRT
jgi:hypothetical protein